MSKQESSEDPAENAPESSKPWFQLDQRLANTPEFDFEVMSDGGSMIFIRFGETRYELKRTRSGRLVLHK